MEDEKWRFTSDDNPRIDEKRQQSHKNYKGFFAWTGRESFIFVYKKEGWVFCVSNEWRICRITEKNYLVLSPHFDKILVINSVSSVYAKANERKWEQAK